MRQLPTFLLLATAGTAFSATYSVKYDASYSYVVRITDGKFKDIFLAERSEKGLAKIPQTVRIEGSNFSILCDLHMKGPGGTAGIALANLKGEVQLAKNSAPKIGKNIGVPLKELSANYAKSRERKIVAIRRAAETVGADVRRRRVALQQLAGPVSR